ncbi:MAG: hypothetical protein L6W00_11855 [Lentisphaeria bacterium]|nr:MAG: hypothetical protein L6W00_11855 [Lentisphaeria bacterium]
MLETLVCQFSRPESPLRIPPCPGGKTSRTDGKQLRNTGTPAHFPLLFSKKDFWQKSAFPS